MSKHILVPLDGSTLAERAVEQAAQLLNADDRLTLLAVVPVPDVPIYDFYPAPSATLHAYETRLQDGLPIAKDYLERIADPFRSILKVEVSTLVETGEPHRVIIETVKKLDADMIVMSTHGRSGLSRLLFGSVTSKILAAACCPVVVVPNCAHHAEGSTTSAAAVA